MAYTADWFSWNIDSWSAWTACFRDQPIRVLEIGSFEGKSARWIVDNLLGNSESRMDCVDTWSGSVEHEADQCLHLWERFEHNLSDAIESGKVIPHRGLSQIELPKLSVAGNSYDLVYIDGSHTSRDVLSDAVHVFPLVKEGGIIIFDDYFFNRFTIPQKNPRMGIDAFLQVYHGCYDIIAQEWQVVIRKKSDAWLYEPGGEIE